MASQADYRHEAAEQARHWIARMASGAFGPADLEGFQAWLGEDASNLALLEHERATWQALDALPPHAFRTHETQARPPTARAPRSRRPARRRIAAGIAALAACFALALAWPSLLLHARADHRTGAAVSPLSLDDGSAVVLDAGSAIAVDYGPHQRRIRLLRGAAWFEVAHDDARPFVVEARDGHVRDIGTAFSVQLDDTVVRTRVSAGAVDVRTPHAAPTRLVAGQGAGYGEDGAVFALADAAPDDIAPWRHGEILFDDVPIAQALRELARYRERPLWLAGDMSGTGNVTAVFAVDAPDEAIDTLVRMGGLVSRSLPGGVRLVHRRGDG